MNAMRAEIVKNYGVELSLERIRKLRKVASAFLAGRRRPGVSLETHLEAGTPDALDEFVKAAPKGIALTREYIRQSKNPTAQAEQAQQVDERRRQRDDERVALLQVCKRLEHERDQFAQKYADERRSAGKEPEPVSPSLVPDSESLTPAEDLEQAVATTLIARGIDPKVDHIKKALGEFVKAVMSTAQ